MASNIDTEQELEQEQEQDGPSPVTSYRPEMNKYVDKTITRTRRKDVFTCKEDHVRVKVKRDTIRKGKGKRKKRGRRGASSQSSSQSKPKTKTKRRYRCLHLKDNRTKKQLQRLLNRRRVSKCVTAPNQRLSNCWFNTMFMSFFVSDKGYKFTKALRQIMIHGKRLNGTELDEKMKLPFMQLNAAVQASIDCTNGRRYLLNNTNIMIEQIARDLPDKYRDHTIFRVREPGGPLEYYRTLINYLLQPHPNQYPYALFRGPQFLELLTNPKSVPLFQYGKNKTDPPDIIVGEIRGEMMSQISPRKKPLQFRLNNKYEYKLDSFILANEEHYISFHMIQGKEMGFDGASRSRLAPFKWRKQINTDKPFNLYKNKKSVKRWNFNFTKNQQFLIYFRTK